MCLVLGQHINEVIRNISFRFHHIHIQERNENLTLHNAVLKLINSSWSLNKGNHDCVWISDLNPDRFLWFYFSLVLLLIEKINQTPKTLFDHKSNYQTPWSLSKMLCCAPYFQLSSQHLEKWSNIIGLSCSI